ncbi:MAG: hypothetical protein WAW96_03275 [Alphaproteobacteria bacterium]
MSTGSMAIWCADRPGAKPVELEAHFNYWRIAGDVGFRKSKKGATSDFIEVGILVDDPNQIDLVCIFVPLNVDGDAVSDCSARFATADIAQGIFNEVLTTTAVATGGPRCVTLSKAAGPFCRIHSFMTVQGRIDSSELTVATVTGGSLITITRSAINHACVCASPLAPAYFRLRILMPAETSGNPFVQVIPTPDRIFQSGFEEIEYLDFRMNEARTLPAQIEQQMSVALAGGNVSFKLVAFLTAVPVRSELSTSNTPSHKMRLLEHNLWSSYVPGGIPRGMVVYHWKRDATKDPISDFSAFVKLRTRRSGLRILSTYILIVFLFGVLGNLTASALEWFFAPH